MNKKRGRNMWIVISLVSVIIVLLLFIFIPPSFGTIKPYKDSEGNVLLGSIAEKVYVEINGSKQGMIIKGEDLNKPVLLLVHGGPGLSDYFLSTLYETGLEKEFVVCYWEQRGTGLSYHKDLDYKNINKEQFVLDTIEVTEYLRERFNQEKIYLIGHSWGSYLGLMAVQAFPELYHAYIAMSQVVNQMDSEKEAFEYMLNQYQFKNDKKMIKKFNQYDVMASEDDMMEYRKSPLRDQAMHELGVGTMHEMNSVITGLFFPSLRCLDYTIGERIDIWRGKVFSSRSEMLYTIDDFDAREDVMSLEVPIYFFAGIYDYTTSYQLQKEFYEILDAPIKGFYTFHESAHSPIFEEPDFAFQIFTQDIIHSKVLLSDEINP